MFDKFISIRRRGGLEWPLRFGNGWGISAFGKLLLTCYDLRAPPGDEFSSFLIFFSAT